jgi:hypothetical protein
VYGIAGEEDAAFAACWGDALVVDVGFCAGDREVTFGRITIIGGGLDKLLDSLVGTGYDAFFVGGEGGVFDVGDTPLRWSGPVGIAVCVFAGVGYDGLVDWVDDEV